MMLIFFMKFMTSLTSNNCIDANIKIPRIIDKPTHQWVNSIFPKYNRIMSQAVRGRTMAHLNPNPALPELPFRNIGQYHKHSPTYMV